MVVSNELTAGESSIFTKSPAFALGRNMLVDAPPYALLLALAIVGSACSSPDRPPMLPDEGFHDAGRGQLPPSPDGSLVGSPCRFAVPAGARVACGTLTVPEDRSLPNGRTIQLAVAV